MTSNWNVSKIRSFAVALAAGTLLLVGYSQDSRAEQCGGADGAGTYDELVGTSCTIGDKTFSGFIFQPITGDIQADDVSFNIINGANGQWGFEFGFNMVVGTGGLLPTSSDFRIIYDVRCTDNSACIDSIHAAINAGANGGVASLAENYGIGSFFLTTPNNTVGNADFAPVVTLHISKDVNATCTSRTDCFVTFSGITNTVDQVTVPEPGTLALLAGGLLALGWTGRRRRGDRV
jgi:PEP-CTERM motif